MNNKPIKATVLNSAYWNMDKDISNQTFYFITRVNERFNLEILKESLKQVVKDLPVLSRRLVDGFWRDKWVPIENFDSSQIIKAVKVDNVDKVSFYDKAYSHFIEMKNKRLNLEKEQPLKIIVLYNEKVKEKLVVFCTHHSFADPRGNCHLIKLIAERYDDILNKRTIKPVKNFNTMPKLILSYGFFKAFKEFINTPKISMDTYKPLMDMDYDANNTNCKESIDKLEIKGEELNKLKAKCKEFGLTIDGMIMFLSLILVRKYNETLQTPSSHACLSVGIDLRDHIKGDALKIANYAGRDYYPVELKDTEDVYKFSRELKAFRDKQVGVGSVMQFVLPSIFPITMQKKIWRSSVGVALREWTLRTLVTTNIGRLDEFVKPFGDAVEGISAVVASAYCGLPLISVSGYKNELTLYITKFNDKKELVTKIKDDFNQIVNEIISSK